MNQHQTLSRVAYTENKNDASRNQRGLCVLKKTFVENKDHAKTFFQIRCSLQRVSILLRKQLCIAPFFLFSVQHLLRRHDQGYTSSRTDSNKFQNSKIVHFEGTELFQQFSSNKLNCQSVFLKESMSILRSSCPILRIYF